jgi:nucleoside-diphosphate-sugar epimerase
MQPVIAVTGASGNLGRVLVDRLAADPAVERIVALDRKPPTGAAEPRDAAPSKVVFRACDVRDPEIGKHLSGCGALVHLAFIVERGSRDPALVDAVNIGGTRNVIEAAARAGVGQVVHASSIAAYGFHPENLAGELGEDAPVRGNADFYYGRTKAECEKWLDEFETQHPEIAVARLRPSVFLGPRGGRPLAMFRRRLFPYVAGNAIPVHVTHEDDVAEAFALALRHGARGAYNVATSEPIPMQAWPRQMGKRSVRLPAVTLTLADLAYRAELTQIDPIWFRVGRNYPIVVSNQKIRRELRWRPRYETTGAVLRALADTPTAAASFGAKILFGTLATATRLRGGLPLSDRERQEIHSIDGTANLVFTGDHPSEWHISFRGGQLGFYRGLDPDARATTKMTEAVFFDLLSGKLSYSRATMTGKIRFQGEGNFGFLVGGIVGGFRRALHAEGPRGLPYRIFTRLVLSTAQREIGGTS